MGIVLLAAAALNPAWATWNGTASGTIQALEVTHSENFALRVYINGAGNMCYGGTNWAYLNESDSNYKSTFALLMLAKAQGLTVTLYLTTVGQYCRIGHVTVS
jgi:hypothetical protein